ncbi:hypothetical protein [Mycolicibacterium grossiae]|nr:hypothetical protein [Mycolicibacterium grossiae]
MDEHDVGLAMPQECLAWCRAQDYEVAVSDDVAEVVAEVDLQWWNQRLAQRAIPVRIFGRDADGAPTDAGVGALRRGDLDTDAPPVHRPTDLGVLYRAAAWLSGHPNRDRLRRFPDVRTPSPPGHDCDAIITALQACRPPHAWPDPAAGSYRRWSGWPRTPGVGPTLLSLYCWATHRTATGDRAVMRPQLLDQQAVASLIQLGGTVAATATLRFDALLGTTHRARNRTAPRAFGKHAADLFLGSSDPCPRRLGEHHRSRLLEAGRGAAALGRNFRGRPGQPA